MGILRGLETVLRAAVALVLLVAGLGFLCLGAIACALRGGTQRQIHRWYRWFGRWFMFVGATDLRVYGADQVDLEQAYVVVSNHESNWDPPSLLAALPYLTIRFVVKRQLIGIPSFGRTLSLTGNVTVDRSRSRGDVDRLRSSMQGRDGTVSILFFAEGTRSRDGRLRAFKKGAPVVVEIGEPITVTKQDFEQRDALRLQTQEVVSKLRANADARLTSEGHPRPPDL